MATGAQLTFRRWVFHGALLGALANQALGVSGEPQVLLSGSIRPVPGAGGARVTRTTLTATELASPLLVEFGLRLRHFAELESRVEAGEQIPASQIQARYLPRDADVARWSAWLQAHGFELEGRNGRVASLFARASVETLSGALKCRFARVSLSGLEYTSAISAPSLPADLATSLIGISGLQPHLRARCRAAALPPSSGASPRAAAGFLPAQILGAYNGTHLQADGTGQIIGVVGDALPLASDIQAWASYCSEPRVATAVTFILAGTSTGTEDQREATLDAEWSSASAPGAQVRVYGVPDGSSVAGFDLGLMLLYADAQQYPGLRQASISYGWDEEHLPAASAQVSHQIYTLLAAAGVSVFAAAGDGGSNPGILTDTSGNPHNDYSTSNSAEVSYPASDPLVTAVGGTTLELAGSSVADESAWSVAEVGTVQTATGPVTQAEGTGGGASEIYARESWQSGLGIPTDNVDARPGFTPAPFQPAARLVPDVALNASSGSFAMILNNTVINDGGTSFSSPIWAAYCARLNQARTALGLPPLGLLAPRLYALAGTPAFRDIVSGQNGAYEAGVGYDLCTGLGVPNLVALQAYLTQQPSFVRQPKSLSATAGQTLVLSALATGSATYQWLWNALPLTDGTTAIGTVQGSATRRLIISGLNAAISTAPLACAATLDGATQQSTPITVSVISTPTPGTLANLSSRAQSPTTDGVVLAGAAPASILFRDIGPSLSSFGIAGALPDPSLSIFGANGAAIGGPYGPINPQDWSSLESTFSQVSAFPLAQGSADSAAVLELSPGLYTVSGSSVSGDTGVSLLEIYSIPGGEGAADPVNLSSLARLGADNGYSVQCGFTIGGSTAETLLIRCVGPTLASFGIDDALRYANLVLYDAAGDVIASEGAWGGDAQTAALAAAAGAFALPADSSDAALVVSLPPGRYSLSITGANGYVGTALTEIYQLP